MKGEVCVECVKGEVEYTSSKWHSDMSYSSDGQN